MSWSVVIGVAVVAGVIALAYAAVRVTRPVLRRAATSSWADVLGRHGRAGLAWLTVRVAAEIIILSAGAALVLGLAAVFINILDAVTTADGLTAIDRPVIDWLTGVRTPTLT